MVPNSIAELKTGLVGRLPKYDVAEPFLQEVLSYRRRALGNETPETLEAIIQLANALINLRKDAEAEPLIREALKSTRQVLGKDHPATINSRQLMGAVLHRLEKYSEAEPYLREMLEMRRQQLGDEHVATVDAMSALGIAMVKQGKYMEAEPLLLDSWTVLSETNSTPIANGKSLIEARRESLQRLIELYDSWHKAEPSSMYDAMAAEWRTKLAECQATTQPVTTRNE